MARNISLTGRALGIICIRTDDSRPSVSGNDLLAAFQAANEVLYWNLNLSEAVHFCHLIGHIQPYILLIGGPDIHLEAIKLAWSKRLLKSPNGFSIENVGEVSGVEMTSVAQVQFIPLEEALCYIIYDLTCSERESRFESICAKLAEWYRGMQLPPAELIHATLKSLMRQGQVYHTGYGYSIMTADKVHVAEWLVRLPSDIRCLGTQRRAGSLTELSSGVCIPHGPGQTIVIGRRRMVSGCEPANENAAEVDVVYHHSLGYEYSSPQSPGLEGGDGVPTNGLDKKNKGKSFLGRLLQRMRPRKKLTDTAAMSSPPSGVVRSFSAGPGIGNVTLEPGIGAAVGPPLSHRERMACVDQYAPPDLFWSNNTVDPQSPPPPGISHGAATSMRRPEDVDEKVRHRRLSGKKSGHRHSLGGEESRPKSAELNRRSRSRDAQASSTNQSLTREHVGKAESRKHRTSRSAGMKQSRSHHDRLMGGEANVTVHKVENSSVPSPPTTCDSGFNSSHNTECGTTSGSGGSHPIPHRQSKADMLKQRMLTGSSKNGLSGSLDRVLNRRSSGGAADISATENVPANGSATNSADEDTGGPPVQDDCSTHSTSSKQQPYPSASGLEPVLEAASNLELSASVTNLQIPQMVATT